MSTKDRYVHAKYITRPLPAIAAGKTGEPLVSTAASALTLDTEVNQISLSQAADQAFTLADGDEGQRKLVYMTAKTGTGNAVLTPANLTGGTTLTFSAVGEYAELKFISGSWVQVGGTSFVPSVIAAGKVGTPSVSTAASALTLDTEVNQISLSQAADQAFTLADGDEGQRKLVYMTAKTGTGNAVLTPANLTGGTTLTFSAVGNYSELRFITGSWVQIDGTAAIL